VSNETVEIARHELTASSHDCRPEALIPSESGASTFVEGIIVTFFRDALGEDFRPSKLYKIVLKCLTCGSPRDFISGITRLFSG